MKPATRAGPGRLPVWYFSGPVGSGKTSLLRQLRKALAADRILGVETSIVLSIIVAGILVATMAKLPMVVGALLIGLPVVRASAWLLWAFT